MSKPISRALVSLEDELEKLPGAKLRLHQIEHLAVNTIKVFLEDARDEGRFDNAVINQLLADL